MFDFILEKKIKTAFDNNNRKHVFRSEHTIRKVMVLFNIEDWEQVALIVDDLKKRGKQVTAWTTQLTKQSKKISIKVEGARIITDNDTSWFSGVSSSIRHEFEANTYDTMMDFRTQSDTILQYCLALNSAQFSIGIKEAEEKVYDFVVLKDEERGLFETYQQIKLYLNNIR